MSSSKLASISLPAGISSQIFMFFFHQTFLWSHWQRSWSQLAGRESRFHLKVGRPGPGLHSKLGLQSHFSNTTPWKIRLTKKNIYIYIYVLKPLKTHDFDHPTAEGNRYNNISTMAEVVQQKSGTNVHISKWFVRPSSSHLPHMSFSYTLVWPSKDLSTGRCKGSFHTPIFLDSWSPLIKKYICICM